MDSVSQALGVNAPRARGASASEVTGNQIGMADYGQSFSRSCLRLLKHLAQNSVIGQDTG